MSENKIMVMILINQLGYGGAPKLIFDLVRAFNKEYFEVKVAMWGGRRDLYEDISQLGVEVIDFQGKTKYDIIAFLRLYKYLKKNKVNILHTHLPFSHIIGRLAGRLAGVPKIVSTLHNVYQSQHLVSSLIDRWSLDFSDIVTAVSPSVEISYFQNSKVFEIEDLNNGKDHFTIYNGVDISKIDYFLNKVNKEEKATSLRLVSNKFNIICAARLHPNKGHIYLIKAIAKISYYSQDIHLYLLGDGPLEEFLKEQVKELKIEKYVTFLGYRKDVYEIFTLADILVLPSLNEGLPIVAPEAMASYLPIVATNIPALEGVVEHNVTGLLVPPADVAELAKAIEYLKANPYKLQSFAKNGRLKVEKLFSIASTAKQYESVYALLAGDLSSVK